MPELKKPTEIEFFFEYDKEYRIVAANGAWGGITPRGDIQIDFFVERSKIPESVKNEVTEEGTLGEEIERKPGKQVARRLQTGVLLSPGAAQSLADFILKRIEELNKRKEMK